MKYVLKKPVTIGEAPPVTELIFREELVAGDMRGIQVHAMNHDDFMKIAGRLSGQPDPVILKLSLADWAEVLDIVAGFINGGRETGTTPSPS